MNRESLVAACRSLPLFPLPGVVLLPANPLPLHVFEPRYRQLVRDCLGSGGPVCVPEVEAGPDVDMTGAPPFLPYAGVGVIAAHQERPDGRFNILLEPVGRVRIVEELGDTGHPYRVGRAELLQDAPVSTEALEAVGERIRGFFRLAAVTRENEGLRKALDALPPARVPDALAGLLLRETRERQAFLAQDNPLARATIVESALLAAMAAARPDPAEA